MAVSCVNHETELFGMWSVSQQLDTHLGVLVFQPYRCTVCIIFRAASRPCRVVRPCPIRDTTVLTVIQLLPFELLSQLTERAICHIGPSIHRKL